MRKKMFYGLSVAAMLMVAPTASAYWTGHAEALREMIEEWITSHSDQEKDTLVGKELRSPLDVRTPPTRPVQPNSPALPRSPR